MQCKDIPDQLVLEWLDKNTNQHKWATHWGVPGMPTVRDCIPEGTPEKLHLAKMRQLIKRGLVEGCGCGCRGDFYLSEKGKEYLNALLSE